jgi:hypothetical protein
MHKLSVLFAILSRPLFFAKPNLASVAWRRAFADRCGHPSLEIMNPAGCKSDESNQFSQLEIWKPRPGSSIRIGGWTWFRNRNRLGLITALEREASVEVQVTLTSSRVRSSLEGGSCNQFILVGKKTHGCAIAAHGWRSESRAMKAAWSSHRHNGGTLCGSSA